MSQLRRGDMVSWAALDTICTLLECQPGDLICHEKGTGVDKTAEGNDNL
jgi:DNA-binding Xre family transcriptional regulator